MGHWATEPRLEKVENVKIGKSSAAESRGCSRRFQNTRGHLMATRGAHSASGKEVIVAKSSKMTVTLIADFTITVRHWQSENTSLYIAYEGPMLRKSAVLPIEIRLKTPSWQTCMKLSKTGVLHVLVCL